MPPAARTCPMSAPLRALWALMRRRSRVVPSGCRNVPASPPDCQLPVDAVPQPEVALHHEVHQVVGDVVVVARRGVHLHVGGLVSLDLDAVAPGTRAHERHLHGTDGRHDEAAAPPSFSRARWRRSGSRYALTRSYVDAPNATITRRRDRGRRGPQRVHGRGDRVVERPAVDPGRHQREGDRERRAELVGDGEGAAVAGHQQVAVASRPRCSSGRRRGSPSEPAGRARGSSRRSPVASPSGKRSTHSAQQSGPGGGVDRPVDPAAAAHPAVGGVDDGVDLLRR